MTSVLHAYLLQDVTYWSKGNPDGYGGFSYNAPVVIKGRWEQRSEMITDAYNIEYVSRARVFVDRDLDVDGYLYLGVSVAANPGDVSGAHKIRDFRRIPDLFNLDVERRAML